MTFGLFDKSVIRYLFLAQCYNIVAFYRVHEPISVQKPDTYSIIASYRVHFLNMLVVPLIRLTGVFHGPENEQMITDNCTRLIVIQGLRMSTESWGTFS